MTQAHIHIDFGIEFYFLHKRFIHSQTVKYEVENRKEIRKNSTKHAFLIRLLDLSTGDVIQFTSFFALHGNIYIYLNEFNITNENARTTTKYLNVFKSHQQKKFKKKQFSCFLSFLFVIIHKHSTKYQLPLNAI